VLLAFVGFFMTVFAVNGVMIYEAVSTFGGLETPDAYRKGLAYNQRIAQGEAQEQRGWRDTLAYAPETERVRIDMTDHAGAAVPDLVISGEMGRPATDRFDSAGDRPGGIERGLCIGFRVAEDLWGNPSPRMILRP
jgi:nitrogen fixation protein FixH